MSIWPGQRFAGNVAQVGSGPLEEPGEGGECYARKCLSIAPFLSIRIYSRRAVGPSQRAGFRASDFRIPAPPGCVLRTSRLNEALFN
jgi:hypothetical protein